MCSCQRGKVKCEPIVCPATNCTAPIIEEAACCPTCSSAQPAAGRGCNFGGDSFFHPAGSRCRLNISIYLLYLRIYNNIYSLQVAPLHPAIRLQPVRSVHL